MAEFLPVSRRAEDHWLSVSDLMTGLMVIFLFIAVSYMMNVRADRKRIIDIAQAFQDLHAELFKDLQAEFKDDLDKNKWGEVELVKDTLTVRFKEPEVLFERGSAVIRPRFKDILDDFFPRYVSVLLREKYRENIEEVRIEGHTSSEWGPHVSLQESYFLNMALSQERTRSVLQYVLGLRDARIAEHLDWLRRYVTANGLSFSKRIEENGVENKQASRRVEFRVRTHAERQMRKILDNGQTP